MIICNNCNSKEVELCHSKDTGTYKGVEYQVDMHYTTCTSCGEESINKSQYLLNESNIREAKKEIDGLLSAEEVKSIRELFNLTQNQASVVFGGGVNAFSKYERKEVSQSKSMDKLLRLAALDRNVFKQLLIWADIDSTVKVSCLIDSDNFIFGDHEVVDIKCVGNLSPDLPLSANNDDSYLVDSDSCQTVIPMSFACAS